MQEMIARLCLILALLCNAATAQAQQPPRPLSAGMAAMRQGDWTMAAQLAGRDGVVGGDIIEWQRLRAGRGTWQEVVDFLDRNGDWPGIDLLRRRSEEAMAKAPDAQILQFFSEGLPQTAEGAMAHARALLAGGHERAAHDTIILAWRSLSMGEDTQTAILALYGDILADHHTARLDTMLWRGEAANAERMLPLVDAGWRSLAKARIALRARQDGVDTLIEAVPQALSQHAGLAYERFLWRARAGRTDSAVELLLAQSSSATALGNPGAWGNWRRILTREKMRAGDFGLAYRIASQHFLLEGTDYADLEWLAGYLSLKLENPARALDHFKAFAVGVESPISLGRAGYWIGRAYDALGDTEAADRAYSEAALHQTSFYGLLAAEKAGLEPDPVLRGDTEMPSWRGAGFVSTSVFQAGVLSLAAGEHYLAERFFVHLAERLSPEELGSLGNMAIELGSPHIAVMLGKQGARQGAVLPGPYFARHPLESMDLGVPSDLLLSIARRESEFDPLVVSPVGARGLMQIMPGTAQDMAREVGVQYNEEALLADWRYNARLGAAYLRKLHGRFDGNPIMIAAAYNAGPSRPTRWMQEYGDPRGGTPEVMVDWIETIPFRETRNYVMRVTEAMMVYRMRLGQQAPGTLGQLISGRL
ncbi:soluble lytic murein transglycosylase [Poseidonocella pacifica]|uniref:Soluble lytic murein transglycosylase n=1 Tax=Poseidonocella pacifica TaxID=871651 RepID=A0A1I0WBN8_9RHOB|nr:transglycosylase SLT domain-containing protein [Poseidonocella pacifica]SFA86119.1 soluble lytic murein transglycosylase [Poseidonocella pacifica]